MVFEVLAVLVWLSNPYASLLVLPALHLWLGALLLRRPLFARRARPLLGVLLTLAGLIPLGLVLAYYASAFGMGPLELLHAVVMFVAAGGLGAWGLLAWSIALGCLAAILLAVLLPVPEIEGDDKPDGSDGLADRLLPALRGPLTTPVPAPSAARRRAGVGSRRPTPARAPSTTLHRAASIAWALPAVFVARDRDRAPVAVDEHEPGLAGAHGSDPADAGAPSARELALGSWTIRRGDAEAELVVLARPGGELPGPSPRRSPSSRTPSWTGSGRARRTGAGRCARQMWPASLARPSETSIIAWAPPARARAPRAAGAGDGAGARAGPPAGGPLLAGRARSSIDRPAPAPPSSPVTPTRSPGLRAAALDELPLVVGPADDRHRDGQAGAATTSPPTIAVPCGARQLEGAVRPARCGSAR